MGRSPRLAVKFIDERLRCDVSVRVCMIAATSSQSALLSLIMSRYTPSQSANTPRADVGGLKNRSGSASPFLLNTRWDRTPQRDSPIFVVVVVEVAQRSPASNKEARFAMADALADPWQLEGDLSYPSVLTHRARLAGPARRRNEPRERRTSPTRIGSYGAEAEGSDPAVLDAALLMPPGPRPPRSSAGAATPPACPHRASRPAARAGPPAPRS